VGRYCWAAIRQRFTGKPQRGPRRPTRPRWWGHRTDDAMGTLTGRSGTGPGRAGRSRRTPRSFWKASAAVTRSDVQNDTWMCWPRVESGKSCTRGGPTDSPQGEGASIWATGATGPGRSPGMLGLSGRVAPKSDGAGRRAGTMMDIRQRRSQRVGIWLNGFYLSCHAPHPPCAKVVPVLPSRRLPVDRWWHAESSGGSPGRRLWLGPQVPIGFFFFVAEVGRTWCCSTGRNPRFRWPNQVRAFAHRTSTGG